MRNTVYILIHLYMYVLICTATKEEYITIKHIQDIGEYRRHKREVQVFPPNLRFTISPHNIELRLLRNKLSLNVPYYVTEDDKIVKRISNIDKEIIFYHDIEKSASIGVHCAEHNNIHCLYRLKGHLVLNGKYHSIRPQFDGQTDGEENKHILEGFDGQFEFAGDYHDISDIPGTDFKSRRLMSTGSSSSTATEHYKVEFLPFIDYSIYQFWYNRSEGNAENAVSSIKEYYAYVINSMNVHYASITDQIWDMEILYAGIYIADTMSASTWTESIKTERTGDRLWVDIDVALNNFKEWLRTTSGLPEYDHAMAFTGYELYSGNFAPGILGKAWLQGICFKQLGTYNDNGIVEDHYEAIVGPVAAHELGHNLGSKHDGQIGCSDSDRYIMTSSVGATSGDKATNHYRFSSCSLTKFNAAFDFLNTHNFNCLKELSSDSIDLNDYNDTLYGQQFSPDEQCQQYLGDSSVFCRSEHTDDPSTICEYMMCSKLNEPCKAYFPWEGTVCGDKKWCVGGVCCDDPRAASADPMCVFGDDPNCAMTIPASPFLCYGTDYSQSSCCLICQEYYTDIPGCEYGDRENGCVSNDCNSYSENKRNFTCCKTCFIETTTDIITTSEAETTTTEAATTSTEASTSIEGATTTTEGETTTTGGATTTSDETITTTTVAATTSSTRVTTLKQTTTTSGSASFSHITRDVFVIMLVICIGPTAVIRIGNIM